MRRALSCVAMLLLPLAALAEEINCHGWLNGSFDNVNVPAGADCSLSDAYVKGNITVREEASLTVYEETVVRGNIQAEKARYVRLLGRGVRVDGNVQIKYGSEATVINPDTEVSGSIQYVENYGFLKILGAFIGQDVQIFKNAGGVSVYANVIHGNFQCKENRPRPTGDRNRVGGNKEEQCDAF